MRVPDIWTIVYSAPEESPKEQTGDIFPVNDPRGRPLLHRAIDRAQALSSPARVMVAVLEQEEPWWSEATAALRPENIVKQPFDRGSATGILLALSRVFHRDPEARVVIFCSDHVDDDVVPAIHGVLDEANRDSEAVFILGRRPRRARSAGDPVWMVLRPAIGQTSLVTRLIFDPNSEIRDKLADSSALLATPVVVTSVWTGLELFAQSHPDLSRQLDPRVNGRDMLDPSVLEELYPFLHAVDFFREVLGASPERLTAWPMNEVTAVKHQEGPEHLARA